MSEAELAEAAFELSQWFARIVDGVDKMIEGITDSKEHRDAALMGILSRNATSFLSAPIDHAGSLYSPLCLCLASACLRLGIKPTAGNWRAAIDNLVKLTPQLPSASLESVGVDLGTPASIFKSLTDEALINAGMTDRPTFLNESNRKTALGLAINWGLRFALAYAADVRDAPAPSGAKDIHWLHRFITRLLAAPKSSV